MNRRMFLGVAAAVTTLVQAGWAWQAKALKAQAAVPPSPAPLPPTGWTDAEYNAMLRPTPPEMLLGPRHAARFARFEELLKQGASKEEAYMAMRTETIATAPPGSGSVYPVYLVGRVLTPAHRFDMAKILPLWGGITKVTEQPRYARYVSNGWTDDDAT